MSAAQESSVTVSRPASAPGTEPGGPGGAHSGQDPRVLEVVIIGAGQAGLAAAGELVRRGMAPGPELLVLDAEEGPGGAWRHRWDSLTIGRAHHIADLPHFPAGELDSSRPSSAVVPEYYGRFEAARGLNVLRPVRVTAVRSTDLPAVPLAVGDKRVGRTEGAGKDGPTSAEPMAGRQWPGGSRPGAQGAPTAGANGAAVPFGAGAVRRDTLLAVDASTPQGPRTWLTRMVVSAAGTWSHPYVPYVPGVETFAGRQLHTVGYRRAEDFAGQRVVVVGGGLSAVQMLLEIAPHTAATTWATRRPPDFSSADFDEVWGAEVEQAVDARTAAGQRPVSVVRTTGIPMLPAYQDGVRSGVLVSRGMFDRVGSEGVRFSPAVTAQDAAGLGPSAGSGLAVPESWDPYSEPTWVRADVIIWNTGFRAALRHLAPLRLRESPLDAGPRSFGEQRPGALGSTPRRAASVCAPVGRPAEAGRSDGTGRPAEEGRAERVPPDSAVARRDSGIRMVGRVAVAADPRVLLVGYGSSASTHGATRAGAEAARIALRRLRA
ncbi:NAD(P)-binding domain-containing protein [Actinomyces howellii]|uniref:4-hydroxyacetophenone monooxygenase n=1 Tax=Actinomyces howellii TaxID=52771 RepID=A0A3S5EH19_9ACTO|nr:NAD(P)-binding domain-containing protein [Actinomyces howellii]VEG28165.1 4-hydroxyacetophenone monooxygenase [Actinomyces howellii]